MTTASSLTLNPGPVRDRHHSLRRSPNKPVYIEFACFQLWVLVNGQTLRMRSFIKNYL